MSRVLLLGNSDVVIYNFRLEIVEQLLIAGHEVFISSPYGRRIDDLIRLGCRYEKTKISRHGKNPFEDIRLLQGFIAAYKAGHCFYIYNKAQYIWRNCLCTNAHSICCQYHGAGYSRRAKRNSSSYHDDALLPSPA